MSIETLSEECAAKLGELPEMNFTTFKYTTQVRLLILVRAKIHLVRGAPLLISVLTLGEKEGPNFLSAGRLILNYFAFIFSSEGFLFVEIC